MRKLLAEIHNKISQDGSNLSDRLEDKLTGDFFGAVRYLPFELGLKHVFTTADFYHKDINENWNNIVRKQKGYMAQMEFWYRDEEGEIDVLITSDKMVIGIEIKYLSGISSEDQDDAIPFDYTESLNQLARYSRMIEKLSGRREAYLLFLAPYKTMKTVMKSILNRSIISPSVGLGFMCWEDILESLKTINLNGLEAGQQLIINDLQTLLTKKGFIRFNGFNIKVTTNQPIMKAAYSFKCKSFISEETWNWPTKIIEEDVSYVYYNN